MRIPAASLLLLAACSANAASFSYTGRLDDGGRPANGLYDLQLTAFPAEKAGAALAAPVVFERVPVQDGQFRLEFDLPDAGLESAWVEVAVRATGGGGYSRIPARAKAIATPLIGQCWATTGDTGSNPATNFLGTIDNQPFVVRTRNTRSLVIEPGNVLFNGTPTTSNTVAGSSVNLASAGVRGATIGGGGAPSGDSDPDLFDEGPNIVSDHYGTIGGGLANVTGNAAGSASDRPFAVVGGGVLNTASGVASSVGGGSGNASTSTESTVAGGRSNLASGAFSVVGGGFGNEASGQSATVAGGALNSATGGNSFVGGGSSNTASGTQSGVAVGSNNCAGGVFSSASGRRAKIRPGTSSGAPADGCNAVALSGDADGDEGTYAWADATDRSFTSTGANQFLVRASGGLVMQKQIAAETSARQPRGYFNVVQGDSGLAQPATPRADTVASFESDTDA
ncbi:MAG: hypothetical protein JNL89_04730, partial [Rhodanobacteraceae bacterium]|nr:hypothetical protein [Rhodanobacteraceae bacterium]